MNADSGRLLVQRALSPLAARLTFVSPNALTWTGLGVAVLGGTSFALSDRSPVFFLTAIALGILYGFLDALDGLVARIHKKESAWGDFLDHTFDRLAAIVAIAGLTLARHCNDRLGLVLMLGTLFHGFLGTQIEASFGRRVYQGVGIAESIALVFFYGITAFAIRVLDLPFYFREPLTGIVLSVTDVFILASFPLMVVGSVQRFLIGHDLASRPDMPDRYGRTGKPGSSGPTTA